MIDTGKLSKIKELFIKITHKVNFNSLLFDDAFFDLILTFDLYNLKTIRLLNKIRLIGRKALKNADMKSE
jgi:hypothetical protein